MSLDRRFAEIGRMLEGRPPECEPISAPLNLEDKGMTSLSPFHRLRSSSIAVTCRKSTSSRAIFLRTAADIRNFTRAKIDPTREAEPLLRWALDPERLAVVARWFTGLWLAWLIALYVPGVPNTVEFIVLTNSLSMALCVMPQLPIARTFLQVPIGVVLGGAIYVLVMPISRASPAWRGWFSRPSS